MKLDPSVLERAAQRTHAVVAATSEEQLDAPTPCPDWKVRDLLEHLNGNLAAIASAASDRSTEEIVPPGTGHVSAYDRASSAVVSAFQDPSVLERKLSLPWGETPGSMALSLAIGDTVAHGWDLAQATGEPYEVDDDVAEAVYRFTTGMMEPQGSFPRGSSFGPVVDVAPDAPIQDRMLAYLDRDPAGSFSPR